MRLTRSGLRAPAPGDCEVVSAFRGRRPRLAALTGGRLVLVLQESTPGGEARLVSRGVSPDGGEWRAAARVTDRSLERLASCGRPLVTPRGTIVLPTLWSTDGSESREVRCFLSEDGGASWFEGAALSDYRGAQPTAISMGRDRTVLALPTPGGLRTHTSTDELRTSHPAEELAAGTPRTPDAIVEGATGLAVVWVDANADTALAPPYVPSMRGALSTDAGASWLPARSLPLRPGCLPTLHSGLAHERGFAFLIEQQCGSSRDWTCVAWDPSTKSAARPSARPKGPSVNDSEALRLALLVLTTHTLERPRRSPRLFVEGYFMRSLVAAEIVLAEDNPTGLPWIHPGTGIQRAIDWADSLVVAQSWGGFWKLGYNAEWYADMAAAVGLFPALEAHVDTARAARYERAAARFLWGLERERMWLPNGAVGVGRNIVIDRRGGRNRPQREPYLVSTALAGVAVPAWLYRRTGKEEYRDRDRAALDYTLSQISPDGFAEPVGKREGSLRIAAYVQEGWMAADAYLGDPQLRRRLRDALRPHVDWLLRLQKPDGTWEGEGTGGFSRTPAIVDFLIWYDQACQSRRDVQRAVARAGAVFADPDRWRDWGLYRVGEDHEVLRALAGRPLAALVADRPVQ